MNLKYCLLLSAVSAAGLSIACSSHLDSCEARRTCAPGGAVGGKSSGGDAGAAADGGVVDDGAGRGGASGNEAGSSGEGGEGGEGGASDAFPALFDACSVKGAFTCVEHASPQRLACDGKQWQAGTTCAAGQFCDSSDAKCRPAVVECAAATPGAGVCRGDVPLTCGQDLVTASEAPECEGVCEAGVCKPPSCGDSKLEKGEECEPSASAPGACVECKKAKCGDGAVYPGVEQCDDGNTKAGDGCSASCLAEPVELALGNGITCVRSSTAASMSEAASGLVKCWGYNEYGALGLGDTTNRGDSAATVPSKLDPIALGTGRKAVAISARGASVCAVLDNGELKCWGNNQKGQLGTGDTKALGDGPEEMGDKLKAVSLGGSKVVAVSAADSHTCALLDGGGVKCWGSAQHGQLGQDRFEDFPSPKDLPTIKLARPKAIAVSASNYLGGGHGGPARGSSCALLDNGAIQCWGDTELVPHTSVNDIDKSTGIGDYAGEMAALPVLTFAGGLGAKSVIASNVSAAVLSDGTLRLWGSGYPLARPDAGTVSVGLTPAEFAALPPISIGSGTKVKSLSVSQDFACAVVGEGVLKCWGKGSSGQLGLGATSETTDAPSDLPAVYLGGTPALQVATGAAHACAILADGTLKCWGGNYAGQLGLGDTTNRGDVGDKLAEDTTVDLSF